MKNKRSSKVFGTLEEVYSRKQYMGEREGLRKYKRGSSII